MGKVPIETWAKQKEPQGKPEEDGYLQVFPTGCHIGHAFNNPKGNQSKLGIVVFSKPHFAPRQKNLLGPDRGMFRVLVGPWLGLSKVWQMAGFLSDAQLVPGGKHHAALGGLWVHVGPSGSSNQSSPPSPPAVPPTCAPRGAFPERPAEAPQGHGAQLDILDGRPWEGQSTPKDCRRSLCEYKVCYILIYGIGEMKPCGQHPLVEMGVWF